MSSYCDKHLPTSQYCSAINIPVLNHLAQALTISLSLLYVRVLLRNDN